MKHDKHEIKNAFYAAFPKTIPILAGFMFLGIAYGIYMNTSGFNFLYPMFMSLIIFGGSIEFVAVGLLLGPFDPVNALLLALMINSRHLFYGISMLEKYNLPGLRRYYLIYGMCDESFSINYTAKVPSDVDAGLFMLFVTLLNQIYWVTGATIGGLFGSLVTFNTEGLEFVMTALFVVIFLEQWMNEANHTSSIVGIIIAGICLVIFGASNFLIPTMLSLLIALSLLRKSIQTEEVLEP